MGAGEAGPSFVSGIGVTGMPKDGRNDPKTRTRAGKAARAYARLTKADRLSIEMGVFSQACFSVWDCGGNPGTFGIRRFLDWSRFLGRKKASSVNISL